MASGIKVLHDPKGHDVSLASNQVIDVIAIHGIGAHPDDTWVWKKGERTHWLADPDMLPKAIPHARIMRFGYESTWFGTKEDGPKRTNVSDIAEMLLTELQIHRQDATRPIIFIAHSYGGLVLLQALRRSFDYPGKWASPFRYTAGLVFFGTPFRGRAGLSLKEMVEVVLANTEEYMIYSETMALSVEENPYLQDIVSRYTETRQEHPIPLWCFYETKPSPVGKVLQSKAVSDDYIVPLESACLDISKNVHRHPLERHHYNLQKFPRVHDAAYRAVEDKIVHLVKGARRYLQERTIVNVQGAEAFLRRLKTSPNSWFPAQHQSDTNTDAQIKGSVKFPILMFSSKSLLDMALGAENVGPYDVEAILECLDSNIDEDDARQYIDDDKEHDGAGKQNEDAQCQQGPFKVLQALEDARNKGFPVRKNARKDLRTNSNHPFQLDLAKVTQFQSATRLQHNVPLIKPNQTPLPNDIGMDEIKNNGFGSRSQIFEERELVAGAEESLVAMADQFFDSAWEFYHQHIRNLDTKHKIRVAILDTGVHVHHNYFRTLRRSRKKRDHPIKEVKSFVGEPEEDTIGHGTDVAALVLKMAPETDLYIAKIAHGQMIEGADPIAQAIEWAQDHDVDIITMAFGFDNDHSKIKRAISKAEYNGVIILAAAGGNRRRAFPASMDQVICIHASNGNGYPSGMNPFPEPHDPNLTTLGVSIRSIVDNNVYLSGASSCPIATGMAANVLYFIHHLYCNKSITKELRDEAFSRSGMMRILVAMADHDGSYSYIAPWRKLWTPSSTVDDVACRIKDALDRRR